MLEELTRRLPGMRLVTGQSFEYQHNTTFRGPKHLLVEWDAAPAAARPARLARGKVQGGRRRQGGVARASP